MRPSDKLLHGLLSMGTDAWEEKKFDFALSGSAVDAQTNTKLLACASGHFTSVFFSDVKRFIFSHESLWDAVPPAERTAHASATCFQMLSSSGGAAAALLQHPLECCYPYKLFAFVLGQSADGVDVELTQDRPCTWDHFTQDHYRRYGEENLLSAQSKADLACIAHEAEVHIASIEARHATVRRLLLRSIQTWSKTLPQVSSDFLLLRQRILEQRRQLLSAVTQVAARPRKGRRGSRRERKTEESTRPRAVQHRQRQAQRGVFGQRGTSSSWKVYYQEKRQGKGGLPSKAEMKEISESYKALPLREKRRLQKAATKRSRRNRAHADPAAAELIRQHKAAAKRPLALQAETDLTLEPADALVALGAEDIGLKAKLDRLRQILRSNSQQARTDQQAKRQRLYEDISQLSLPGGVAGAAHAAPLEAASRMRALPNSGFGVVEFHPAGLDLTQFAPFPGNAASAG